MAESNRPDDHEDRPAQIGTDAGTASASGTGGRDQGTRNLVLAFLAGALLVGVGVAIWNSSRRPDPVTAAAPQPTPSEMIIVADPEDDEIIFHSKPVPTAPGASAELGASGNPAIPAESAAPSLRPAPSAPVATPVPTASVPASVPPEVASRAPTDTRAEADRVRARGLAWRAAWEQRELGAAELIMHNQFRGEGLGKWAWLNKRKAEAAKTRSRSIEWQDVQVSVAGQQAELTAIQHYHDLFHTGRTYDSSVRIHLSLLRWSDGNWYITRLRFTAV